MSLIEGILILFAVLVMIYGSLVIYFKFKKKMSWGAAFIETFEYVVHMAI